MENLKPDFPVIVTARHMENTDSIRNYIETKLARIHLKYPRITEAKAVIDHTTHGESVEFIFFCTNQITLQAKTETSDLYEGIDLTLEKVERQMRKEKTKRLKNLGH